jgi:hypothetical protein
MGKLVMNADAHSEASAPPLKIRRSDEKRRGQEWALERGLEETFPASDPVAILQPSIAAGRPEIDRDV